MPNALKEKQVANLAEELKSSENIVITQYQGMTAEQFGELRATIRPLGAKYRVVKNRLAKIAFGSTGFGQLQDHLKGPSAIAYQGKDGAAIVRALFKYAEKNTNFKIKAGRLFGLTGDVKNLKTIADLPSKEVLMATLLNRMNAPLTKLLATMNEPLRSMQGALSALARKKEQAS
jgi:large subunit ribosomal protein L10